MRTTCILLLASAILCAADGKDPRNITGGWEIPSEGYADQPYIVKTDDGAWLVVLTTGKGAQTLEFLSESRFELRKVVWPTRQETTRTTWVVIGVVVLISVILALFDVIIQWAIKLVLGQ